LGVSRLLPVAVPVVELATLIADVGPSGENQTVARRDPLTGPVPGEGHRGALTVLSTVSGGVGVTEAVVGLAEVLAERWRVLVIEAGPISATLAPRLCLDPAYGLAWVLGRVAHGYPALPDGLSRPHPDVGPALGRFDVICQTARPGGPLPADPAALGVLVDEGLAAYEHVLVEIGPLLSSPAAGTGDRFAAGRGLLARADRVVGFAAADPESAARLVEWRVTAVEMGAPSSAWAVFGRVPARGLFEWSHLRALVEDGTGPGGFIAVHRLPEDRVVARARWNGELVWRGRWRTAVNRLAEELAAPLPARSLSEPRPVARPRSLAGEVNW
jgi:hypothetical protein